MARSRSKRLDPWIFRVSAIATVVGLLLTVYFALRQPSYKAIQVQRLARVPLLSDAAIRDDELQIRYGDRELARPVQYVIRVVNTGTVPLERSAIEQPITLDFSPSELIAGKVVDASAVGLTASTRIEGSKLVVDHGLLNPKDWIQVAALADGATSWPTISCRISGVPNPDIGEEPGSGSSRWWSTVKPVLGALAATVLAGMFSIGAISSNQWLVNAIASTGLLRMADRHWDSLRMQLRPKRVLREAATKIEPALAEYDLAPLDVKEDWLESAEPIKAAIESKAGMGESPVSVEESSQALQTLLRGEIWPAARRIAYKTLPSPFDGIVDYRTARLSKNDRTPANTMQVIQAVFDSLSDLRRG